MYYDEFSTKTPDEIDKIINRKSGKARGVDNPKSRRVVNITTGEIFETITLGAMAYGIRPATLSTHLIGKSKSAAGCIWCYENECMEKTPEEIAKIKKWQYAPLSGENSPCAKLVKNKTTGEVFKSITIAAASCNIARSTLSCCLTGKTKLAGGYEWEYI